MRTPFSEEASRPIERHIALQRSLQQLGFLSADAAVDGVYGAGTREAISRWQSTRNRSVTAVLGDSDAQALQEQASQQGAPVTAPISSGSKPEAISGKDAAQRWGLPTLRGLPAVILGQRGNPAELAPLGAYWELEQARSVGGVGSLPEDQAAWTRAIRALGLAAAPQAIGGLDDVALRNLACAFLSSEQREAYYGRNPLYGTTSDVCATGPIFATQRASELPPGLVPLLQAGGARFRQEGLSRLVRDAPKLPLHLLLTGPISMEYGYDHARGGYPLSSSFLSSPGTRLFGSPIDVVMPRFWPRSLSRSNPVRGRPRGQPHRAAPFRDGGDHRWPHQRARRRNKERNRSARRTDVAL